MGFWETLKNKSAAKKAELTYEQYLEYLTMAEEKGYSVEDYHMHLKAVELNMTDEQYREYVADYSTLQPEQFLHFYKARSEGLSVADYDVYLKKYQHFMSAPQYGDYLKLGESYMSVEEYIAYIQEHPQSDEVALELYITTQKAQRLNMTVTQYREYSEKYCATMSADQYLMFCVARFIGLSMEQFLEYWRSYRNQYSLKRYCQYCQAKKENLSLEQYDVWKSQYPSFSAKRYHELLKAQKLNMTLEQYDEYVARFAATMSAEQFLTYCEARKVGLSQKQFQEYWSGYQTQYTLERFYQYCQARKENLSLEQYDEWNADYSSLSSIRFRNLLEARKHNLTLDAYEELQEARQLGFTVEQYREKKIADSLGIRLGDLPFYRTCKSNKESGRNFTVVSSWEEVKIANKLRMEKIILNTQQITVLPNQAFYGCDSFHEIILPWGIREIGECAFSQCRNLRNMTIPGSVKNIPYGIFNGCAKLETIVLLSGIEKVDITGWADIPSLTSVVSAASIKDFVVSETAEKTYTYTDTSSYSFGLEITATTDERKNARTVILKKSYSNIWVTASLTDFVNVETLIVNCDYIDKIEIENCPKIKVIIVDGCINRYVDYYKNGNVKKVSTYTYDIKIPDNLDELKFFIVKDNLEEIECSEACPNLKWLHIPYGTRKIKSAPPTLSAIATSASEVPKTIQTIYDNPGVEIGESMTPMLVSCKSGQTNRIFYVTDRLPWDVCKAEEVEILGCTTVIPAWLFKCCEMNTLRLPETINAIEEGAFADCKNLQTIYLSGAPEHVENNAFQNCPIEQVHGISSLDVRIVLGIYSVGLEDVTELDYTGLKHRIPREYFSRSGATEVVIPKRIKKIESRAFADSKKLAKIVFLGAPDEIAPDAFEGCTEVSDIQWGSCTHWAIAGSTGFPKVKTIELPMEAKEIPEGCFKNWGIESVRLPQQVLKIGAEAFSGCPLTFVNDEGEGVLKIISGWSIEKDAFSGCKLHTVICDCEECEKAMPVLLAPETVRVVVRDTMPAERFNAILRNAKLEAITCIKTNDAVSAKRNASIKKLPANLRKLELPRSIAQINCELLKDCAGLETLEIPETIEEITNVKYFSSVKLKHLAIPADLYHVAVKPHISKQTKVVVTGTAHPEKYVVTAKGIDAHLPQKSAKDRMLIQKVIIPEGSTSIAAGAFENLAHLCSVEINAPIQSIGARAFRGCTHLEQVVLPDSVDSIGEAAFEDCSALVQVELPQGLVKLEARTFAGCSSLQAITIPQTVSIIDEKVFEGCSSLKDIHLPDVLQQMGPYAFAGSGIEKAHIPDGIKRLPEGIFRNCAVLTKVSGMQNVGYVDADAFAFSAVQDLVFSEEIFAIQDAFKGCSGIKRILVPVNIARFSVDLSGCGLLKDLYLPQQIDEFSCHTDAGNSITVHARRGSAWRQKINVQNVDYIKNAEYDELIRIELEKAGLHRSTEPEMQIPATQIPKSSTKGKVSEATHKRASWNTKTGTATSEDVFASGPATVDELLEKMQISKEQVPYTFESVECTLAASSVQPVADANIYVAEETKTISNNIFTISLMRRTMPFPNELYVVLVGKNGQPVSDMKKVKIAQEQCEVISVHLQLNAGTINGEYYLLTASQAFIADSVLSADKCLVDIAFAMDMDFDF